MEKKFKVLMLCFPASGHFNPFFCYGSELAKDKNVQVIMYSTKQNQKVIEGAGIEFREADVDLPSNMVSVKELRKDMPIHKMLGFFMEATDKMMPELVRCINEDGIDLVIYDLMTVYAKWLLKHLQIKYEKGELKRPPPKAITFMPSLSHEKGVYPNSFEEKFLPKPRFSLKFAFNMFVFFLKYISFCFRHSLKIENPFELIFIQKAPLTICCVVPEFQPRSHLFSSSTRFVGNCAAEEVRSEKEFSEPLKTFLAPFPERNPLPLVDLKLDESKLNEDSKLIYVSLGTVCNTDIEPFLLLIKGIKAINKSASKNRFKFLMSVGDTSFSKFQTLIKNKELEIPENLLIMPRVPQLDVLKRASLYITHSGQGGTSESIHYGVPMVCIPVMGDQPAVAYRVCDELGLGVQLDFDNMEAESIKNAAMTVLNDKSYLERIILFSQISRKYKGTQEASKITVEFLQQINKKSN